MLSLLMLSMAVGMGGVPVEVDGDGPSPEPSGPTPPPIDPHCSRKGCGKFGRWQPVLMLGSYDLAGQVPCELHMAVCDDHRAGFDTYCDGDGWRVICEAFAAQLGKGKRGLRRHLSGVDHVAVPPQFAPFMLDGQRIDRPSDWVDVVHIREIAEGIGHSPDFVRRAIMAYSRAELAVGADGFKPEFSDLHEDQAREGATLCEWAWDTGVDLEGIMLVADAMTGDAQ